MFSKSLDSKGSYYTDDGFEVVDLAQSIFNNKLGMPSKVAVFKVSKEFEMRPDLISNALYGSTDYAEMILKYSLINNPFAIEMDDYIFSVSLPDIYYPLKTEQVESKNNTFNAVKNYHKYIDKNKIPDKIGSDEVQDVPQPSEANISKTGDTGLTIKDGKIYFGDIDNTITKVDSSIVNCATNGTTLGDFLNAALRNG